MRRCSREGRTGEKMPVSLGAGDAETAVSQPQGRCREDARTKRRSGSASPAARFLGRRTGARATGGLGSASTQLRVSERQEDAGVVGGWGRRDSGEPATGQTPRGRNWSSARRTCAKARVSNRSERGSRRAGSAWHPGGNSRELVPGDRSTSRAVSHRGDSTLGSDIRFENCVRRTPPAEAWLLRFGRRGVARGGSGARHGRG